MIQYMFYYNSRMKNQNITEKVKARQGKKIRINYNLVLVS